MSALEMFRGKSADWTFAVTQADGVTPLPINGAVMRFVAKAHVDDLDADALITKTTGAGIVLTDPPNGLCQVLLDPADTTSLAAPAELAWGLQITDGSGNTWLIDDGWLVLRSPIVEATP